VAIGAVTGATTSNSRQVGSFTVQLPPQEPTATQPVTPPVQAQAGYRHVPRPDESPATPNSVPLAGLLTPDDKVLTVVSPTHQQYGTGPDPEKEFAAYVDLYSSVAVVRVEATESVLTDARQDWIMSVHTASVQSVEKDTTSRLVAGGLIEIVSSGGEMILDGRRVIAVDEGIEPLKVGGVYLAFLAVLTSPTDQFEGKFRINRLASVEIVNGALKRLRQDEHPESRLEQRSPDWLLQRVRAAAQAGRPQ
jgi:hypothetical protein